MNRKERKIYRNLKKRNGFAYIDPSGQYLYGLTDGGMLRLTAPAGVNLTTLSPEDCNKFIQDTLSKI